MRADDADLTPAAIQALAGRDAVAAFVAHLGYNTNARLVQTKEAMGLTADSLTTQITHIERVASEAGGLFEIYLFELKSVTVTTRQAIVRAFRDRPGDYLLVLTDDYARLDFVLVERYTRDIPAGQQSLPGVPTASRSARVRPRVISLNRRKPDEKVVLRVLRRFSYTEADIFAQYDKLLSAYDVADWSEPYFNNRALFSDYYLSERLPDSPEWSDTQGAAAMTAAYRALRTLYEDVRQEFSKVTEGVVRQKLLEPVLQILGFDARTGQESSGEAVAPDYRLYSVGAQADRPPAVCLAYAWGRNLDGKDDGHGTERADENPGALVVALLEHGEADWAIVTNCKIWRLYAAKAHSRATNYYEIDLEETLALPAADRPLAFRYFWLFFRAAAFVPAERLVAGEATSVSFLDELLAGSERYAHELGERLKERVFEEIFPHFAEGLITHTRLHGGLPANLEGMEVGERNRLLEPFFSGTLTFLYRLLFLLYAESRDLLPAREVRGYYEKSLEKLRREIAEKAGTVEGQAAGKIKDRYSSTATELYDGLQELFGAVDRGAAALNVPLYNGGLFVTQPDPADPTPEAEVARFLASHKIPDRALALGLDRMARDVDAKTHALTAIDYKSLGVRQLGSIYEGLLEFKLRVAPEKMAVIKGKKTEEIVPYAEAQKQKLSILKQGRGKDAPDRTLARGTVYLENDKRERKATGSYYTPDYIVKYIVQNTVGPVLTEKLGALRPAFREAEKALKAERAKHESLLKQGLTGDDPANQAYLKHRDTVNEGFFDLKVLDPAMGSGHFLVEAVDYITDRMVEFLTGFVWNPVVHELAVTRREISAEMEQQGVTIDTAKLTDLNLLKRQVLKRCIYGVDLNPMAVELAKVSLWLDCFTLGAPLSFLDHHMKAGNSLIGSQVDEVRTAIEKSQLSIFGTSLWAGALLATESMIQVGKLSDVTAAQVRESRAEYGKAIDALAPFKRILDVYTSRWFGNDVIKIKRGGTPIDMDKAIDFLRSPEAEDWLWHPDHIDGLNDEQRAVVDTTVNAAQSHRFFHWQLEFPEVFMMASKVGGQDIELREDAGFDAVVGNPPWGGALIRSHLPFLASHYDDVNDYESFQYFSYVSVIFMKDGGRHSFIVPNTYILNVLGVGFRQWMFAHGSFERIVDCSKISVFDDPSVRTIIYFYDKGVHHPQIIIEDGAGSDNRLFKPSVLRLAESRMVEDGRSWTPLIRGVSGFADIVERMTTVSVILDNLTISKQGYIPYRLSTLIAKYGEDMAIAIKTERAWHSTVQNDDSYFPEIQGEDISRFELDWSGVWVKYGRWISSYVDTRFFSGPRLLFREITGQPNHRLSATFTSDVFIHNPSVLNACFISTEYSPLYCLCIVNSSLMSEYFYRTSPKSDKGLFPKILVEDVRRLPIRRIGFTTPLGERKRLVEESLDHRKSDGADVILLLVAACLPASSDDNADTSVEKSDVVHDVLAHLANEMLALNKEKGRVQRELIDWLMTTLKVLPNKAGGSSLDVLTGKSMLAAYPGDYQKGEPHLTFDDLLDILRKNKAKLGVSLTSASLLSELRSTYEASLERVLPLKERLALTDRLIDQIVYRLYGLTEDEIRVVEAGV